MHWFVIHASHSRKREDAYVSCWINFRLYEGALVLATFYIREEGWTVRSVDEYRWFDGVRNVPSASRKYYKEAKKLGVSFVFLRYESAPVVTRKRKAGKKR